MIKQNYKYQRTLVFVIICLILIIITHSCFIKKATVTSINYEPFIEEVVRAYVDEGKVKQNPLIVLNGVPYKFDLLIKEEKLKTFNDTIKSYLVLSYKAGISLYGDRGNDGVIIVSSKRYMKQR